MDYLHVSSTMSNQPTYTIIASTNRPGSNTLKVAKHYQELMREAGIEAKLLSLEVLNGVPIIDVDMYDEQPPVLKQIQEEYLSADKFVMVVPEYNGSAAGITKLFIDATDVKNYWNNKKICLVGVADGRGGNLRGLEHLSGLMLHMKMHVFHLRQPLAQISKELDENDRFKNEGTIKMLRAQIEGFKTF